METFCTEGDACSLAVSEVGFQPSEGLLKSGSNSETLKVKLRFALSKFSYMREKLAASVFGNKHSGVNPQGRQAMKIV